MDTELAEDVPEVGVDSVRGQEQRVGGLAVAAARPTLRTTASSAPGSSSTAVANSAGRRGSPAGASWSARVTRSAAVPDSVLSRDCLGPAGVRAASRPVAEQLPGQHVHRQQRGGIGSLQVIEHDQQRCPRHQRRGELLVRRDPLVTYLRQADFGPEHLHQRALGRDLVELFRGGRQAARYRAPASRRREYHPIM
jgi:hypothetical protein